MNDCHPRIAPYAHGGFTSYSLNFEDVILHRIFAQYNSGFYVDVGAGDPIYENDTYALYDSGWRGINVEPSEGFFRALQEARPRDHNLCLVLSDKVDDDLTYYEIAGSGLSTCDAAQANTYELRGYEVRSRCASVSTLARVLDKAGAPSVDVLKVDVEGMEEQVLAGNDWDRFRPRVVLVEATFPEKCERRPTGIRAFLEARGYRHAYFDGLNDFYLEQDFDAQDAFVLPPNVFDGFVLRQILDLRAAIVEQQRELRSAQSYAISLEAALAKEVKVKQQLSFDVDDLRTENSRLRAAAERMGAEIFALNRALEPMHRLNEELAICRAAAEQACAETERLRAMELQLTQRLRAIKTSSSWRITRLWRTLVRDRTVRLNSRP